jgi:hypothetical protein
VTTFFPSVFMPAQLLTQKLVSKGLAHAQPGRGMLIAIDASVEHGSALAAGAIQGAKLLMLDPEQDAIAQITQFVHRFSSQLQSLHVVTHGSPGCLHFSSGDLTLHNLHIYATQLESWFRYQPLTRKSDIRVHSPNSFLSLYACSLATGDAGEEFLEKLQYLTGVSIHASQGRVSSTARGGSWQLDTSHPFPRQAKFPFTHDLLETYESVL